MLFIKRLIWDDWNVEHIARHGVSPQEVEEVCHGEYISFKSYDQRFQIIGSTNSERILTIILDPEPEEGVYYVVTAHTASRKDRKLYQKEEGVTYDEQKE